MARERFSRALEPAFRSILILLHVDLSIPKYPAEYSFKDTRDSLTAHEAPAKRFQIFIADRKWCTAISTDQTCLSLEWVTTSAFDLQDISALFRNPSRWSVTRISSIHIVGLCVLLSLGSIISCREEVTILIMLLVESLHGLLLWSGTPCGLAVVMRSQVGLGELGGLGHIWPRSSDPLIIGSRKKWGHLTTSLMESKSGNGCSNGSRSLVAGPIWYRQKNICAGNASLRRICPS